jgi:hypothetical protein
MRRHAAQLAVGMYVVSPRSSVGGYLPRQPARGSDAASASDLRGRHAGGPRLCWSAALLEGAPGLLEEVVKTFVVAVHGLAGAFHGTLDVLRREQSRAAPIRGLRLFFCHDREVPRCPTRAPHNMADVYLQAPSQAGVDERGMSGQTRGAVWPLRPRPLRAVTHLGGEWTGGLAIGCWGRLVEVAARNCTGLLVEVGCTRPAAIREAPNSRETAQRGIPGGRMPLDKSSGPAVVAHPGPWHRLELAADAGPNLQPSLRRT